MTTKDAKEKIIGAFHMDNYSGAEVLKPESPWSYK